MRVLILVAVATLTSTAPAGAQETPKVPSDSVRVVATGCLKGRVFAATAGREVDVQSGPDVTGRRFRVAGKKDVMSEVKRHNGNTVEIVGLVRKIDLQDGGLRLKGGRVVIGGGRPMDPTSRGVPGPADHVVVMDVWSVRPVSSGCVVDQRD